MFKFIHKTVRDRQACGTQEVRCICACEVRNAVKLDHFEMNFAINFTVHFTGDLFHYVNAVHSTSPKKCMIIYICISFRPFVPFNMSQVSTDTINVLN